MELLENATDSEDELPEGWEERVTAEGRVYYANHRSRSTQWEHPISGNQKNLTGELPYGWERVIVDENILFVDHLNKKTSYTDPRLAFAKPRREKSLKIKMSSLILDQKTTALNLLKSRDLSGMCAIITGANRGVGYETAKALSFTGCHVIMACRNPHKANQAVESLKKERPGIKLEFMELDLASLLSVKNFVDKIHSKQLKINYLILNAAIFETEYLLSEDNIELMFQVNYLAQFYLTRLLLDNLISNKDSRVVILSCEAHRGGDLSKADVSVNHLNVKRSDFHFLQVFCNTKLCITLFANELNRRFNKMKLNGASCKACHPGNLLPSELFMKWPLIRCLSLITSRFSKSLEQAAAMPVFLATDQEKRTNTEFFYWNNLYECDASIEAKDSVLAFRLWECSENILIDRTKIFDNFLCEGDQFSSYTQTESIRKIENESDQIQV